MIIPYDSLCDEGSKNVHLVEVRKVEGQNPPGHTVRFDIHFAFVKGRYSPRENSNRLTHLRKFSF